MLTNCRFATCFTVLGALLLALSFGCAHRAHLPSHYQETGPSTHLDWESPTAKDVKARYEPAEPRSRDWDAHTVSPESGIVYHWPLYFENPFVDKGHGRTDETDPHNVYRLGWESWVNFPYNYARFTANWLFLPVSAVVTPPWTLMESDGKVSRQALGYDHDATPTPDPAAAPPGAAPCTPDDDDDHELDDEADDDTEEAASII